jgi:membrane-associated phospholipid phosphatase
LFRRVRDRFWLKFLGVSGFMWLFFMAYFYLLRNPARPVLAMPLTAVDGWISFQPWAFWAYVSLWFYVGVPAGLARDLPALLRHGAWAAGLCLTGLACFYVVPTAVPMAGLAVDSAAHAGFAVLQGVDAQGNACPSLHVATALFSACWVHRLLHEMKAPGWTYAVNALWAALIVYSTLAIKQHVLLDVVGGTALAALFAVLSLRSSAARRPGPGR